jgi:long-chain fatty acid transport protein
MTPFNEYKGLISPLGRSDLPAVWAAGLALRIIPRTVIAFDFNRIEWQDVQAYGNRVADFLVTDFDPVTAFCLNPHGAYHDGSAFGWRNRNVYKVGIKYCYSDSLTLRAGYNYGKSPIPRIGTNSSIFLPATVEHHATFGGSWRPSRRGEWSLAWVHGFRNTIKGTEYPIAPPAAEEIFQLANYTTAITAFIEQIALQYTCYF